MATIVVGVDHSPASAAALRWAADEARRCGSSLCIVHAYLAPVAYVGDEEQIARLDPDLHAQVSARLADFVAAADADLTGIEVTRQVHPGRAADGLLSAAADADLLVVGSRGAGGFEGLLLGSAAEHCARHASCPVVVVPASTHATTGRLVVGVDGSASSRRALAWAVAEAERRHAGLEVVGVFRPYDAKGPFGGEFMQLADPGSTARFRRATERAVTEAVDQLGGPGVPITTVVEAGHAAEVLVERAADGDLLVVGRRGRHGFPGLLLGSVSRQVLHHADRPVVVVPG